MYEGRKRVLLIAASIVGSHILWRLCEDLEPFVVEFEQSSGSEVQ
jgi:hypothetical protein